MLRRFFDWLVRSLFPSYRYVYKDSKTGEFVTKEYAKANPDTTYREKVER